MKQSDMRNLCDFQITQTNLCSLKAKIHYTKKFVRISHYTKKFV